MYKLITYNKLLLLVLLLLAIVNVGCNNTKYLAADKTLYKKSNIYLKANYKIPNKSKLKSELITYSSLKPNTKMLGLFRTRLSIYNHFKDDSTGIKGILSRNYSEPPVLTDSLLINRSVKNIERALFDRGYFYNQVDFKTITKNKKTTVEYFVSIEQAPYKIRDIYFPMDSIPDDPYLLPDSSDLHKVSLNNDMLAILHDNRSKSILKQGQDFSEQRLRGEMNRITKNFRNRGYFDFSGSRYIHFDIDSTIDDRLVDVYIRVKTPSDSTQHKKYNINNVYIYPDYVNLADSSKFTDTLKIETADGNIDWYYITPNPSPFKYQAILEKLRIHKNWSYSEYDYRLALKHFLELGVFKYANIRYTKVDEQALLDTYIQLTPAQRKSIALEIELNSISGSTFQNSLLGTALSLSYLDKNLFRGAERFTFNLAGGLELNPNPIRTNSPLINTVDLNTEFTLDIPRFIFPIKRIRYNTQFYIPHTITRLGIHYINRVGLYNLNTYNFGFGYDWRATEKVKHAFNPIIISFIDVSNETPAFRRQLATNPLLQRSFEEQFILGANYTFIYNNQQLNKYVNFNYFRGSLDVSGNTANLVLLPLSQISNINRDKIFGFPYSRYVRAEIDFRHYHYFRNNNPFISRFAFGAGIPYGNSNESAVLPFVKQFFIGGPGNLRAFTIRSLGPGAVPYYTLEQGETSLEVDSIGFNEFDRSGEMKIEANIEYRFNISGLFKGALFADAGNIWNIKDDPNRPDGLFKPGQFWKQIALGTGFGIRMDFSYFVMRFDLATPIHDPRLPEGNRWVFGRNRTIYRNAGNRNIILNLAIGYPF